jgi:hypothetical protein
MANIQAIQGVPDAARPTLKRDLVAGVITGQVSGLIMAVVVMAVFTIFLGKGPLYPVQVIGSFALGDSALEGFNVPAILAGLALHQLGPSLFWGVAFGLAVYLLDVRRGAGLVALAAVTGLLSQAIDVNLVLPVAMKSLHGHDIWAEQVPAFWSWAAHLVFGLGLALFPLVNRRMNARMSG